MPHISQNEKIIAGVAGTTLALGTVIGTMQHKEKKRIEKEISTNIYSKIEQIEDSFGKNNENCELLINQLTLINIEQLDFYDDKLKSSWLIRRFYDFKEIDNMICMLSSSDTTLPYEYSCLEESVKHNRNLILKLKKIYLIKILNNEENNEKSCEIFLKLCIRYLILHLIDTDKKIYFKTSIFVYEFIKKCKIQKCTDEQIKKIILKIFKAPWGLKLDFSSGNKLPPWGLKLDYSSNKLPLWGFELDSSSYSGNNNKKLISFIDLKKNYRKNPVIEILSSYLMNTEIENLANSSYTLSNTDIDTVFTLQKLDKTNEILNMQTNNNSLHTCLTSLLVTVFPSFCINKNNNELDVIFVEAIFEENKENKESNESNESKEIKYNIQTVILNGVLDLFDMISNSLKIGNKKDYIQERLQSRRKCNTARICIARNYIVLSNVLHVAFQSAITHDKKICLRLTGSKTYCIYFYCAMVLCLIVHKESIIKHITTFHLCNFSDSWKNRYYKDNKYIDKSYADNLKNIIIQSQNENITEKVRYDNNELLVLSIPYAKEKSKNSTMFVLGNKAINPFVYERHYVVPNETSLNNAFIQKIHLVNKEDLSK